MWPFDPTTFPESRPDEVGAAYPCTDSALENATYDYIIVGGGTAGCCLASRLSELEGATVLVLERGPVADTWVSRVPMMSGDIYRDGTLASVWPSTPQSHINNSTLKLIIGEALGGTSRVNQMTYTRGPPGDYNMWEQMGRKGWSYHELQPYFVKSETFLTGPPADHRGTEGPWQMQVQKEYGFNSTRHILAAVKKIGFPLVPDINSPKAPSIGCAFFDMAVDRRAYRSSTYSAFLRPEVMRSSGGRLRVSCSTLVTKIAFDDADDKLRAVGVFFEPLDSSQTTKRYYARAAKEIILCAGALANPQILQLSGIGPEKHLASLGIKTIFNSPGVGSNLKDHMCAYVIYKVPLEDTLHHLRHSIFKGITEVLKYCVWGTGLLKTCALQYAIFARSTLMNDTGDITSDDPKDFDSSNPENIPDIEVMAVPFTSSEIEYGPSDGIFSFMVTLLKPKSSGTVMASSTDPRVRPTVDLGFFSHEADFPVARKGLRIVARLVKEVREAGYPMESLEVPVDDTDEALDQFIRGHVRTCLHYSSTCRMAPLDDPVPGVVDDELKVHGVSGLRICDTSIFPEIVSAHTMAPAVVVAEKCADLIKQAYLSSARV